MPEPVDAVLLTGGLAAGKTATAIGLGDALDARGTPYAVVDLDWLCWTGPGARPERLRSLLHDNLRDVAARYAEHGVTRLVLARSIWSDADLAAVRDALASARLLVVLLETDADEAKRRLRARDAGGELAGNLAALEHSRSAAREVAVDTVVVSGIGRGVDDVVADVLALAGW